MTDDDLISRHLDLHDWDPRPEVDLDTVLRLGRAARHRRRMRRGAAGAVAVTVAIVGGGVVAVPRLAGDRSQPAAIGPADTTATPAVTASGGPSAPLGGTAAPAGDITPCAGADTDAAKTVQQDVDIVSSPDYRVADLDNALDVTTAALKTRLVAEEPSLKQTLTQQKTVNVASPLQIGYIDGGCAHPRYLVAYTVKISRPNQSAPENTIDVYVASALPLDGTWKLDALDPVNPPAD